MLSLTNSEVIKNILQILITKIGRRTSESFAVVTLNTVLRKLEQKYPFLKYIQVERTQYSEGLDAVNVFPEINTIQPEIFNDAIGDFLKSSIQNLEHNADYFFIREFEEAFDKEYKDILRDRGIDLSLMQNQYFVNRIDEQKLNIAEIIENITRILIITINKTLPEKQSIELIKNTIEDCKQKYDFLEYIKIDDKPYSEGFYSIKVDRTINNIGIGKIGEAIQEIIERINIHIDWDKDENFIVSFKKEFEEDHLKNIKLLGIDLDKIQTIIRKQEHEKLVKQVLKVLIKIIGEKSSESFAVTTLDKIIKDLNEKHEILKYIKIDRSKYSEGYNAINVLSEINNKDSYKIGKALRDIIKLTGQNLKETHFFIENFKEEMGENYLEEIRKIGINLHFLELKFN
jgi:hypothetical protein